MSTYKTYTLLAILGILAFKVLRFLNKSISLRRRMPPGPPGLPIFGNALQLQKQLWIQFTNWKELYGPIFSLNLAGQPVVVLNNLETMSDLLDSRSTIYSGRPRFIMASETMTGGIGFPFVSYNDIWRRQRRAAHEGFSPRAIPSYQPLQETEAARLALRILQNPASWSEQLKRSIASITLGAVYGQLVDGSDSDLDTFTETREPTSDETIRKEGKERARDEYVADRMRDIANRVTDACMPGNYLVEIFPWMNYLPTWAAPWKREGQQWFETNTQFFLGLIEEVRTKMRTGTAETCFAATLIENEQNFDLSTEETAWVAGVLFAAAVDTTESVLTIFVLAMVLHPDAMRRAQAQIDAVVGRDRLPNFSDLESQQLPYIEAIVKEVMRWRPAGPLGLARCSTEDDCYSGYFIPKGTVVITNVWAINRDPRYFPDFDAFRPERYLDEATGQLNHFVPHTHGYGHVAFGSGRRICPGKDLAIQTLLVNVATLLWAFDIEPALDTEGRPMVPSSSSDAFEGQGIVIHPIPFSCVFKPRSQETSLYHGSKYSGPGIQEKCED